MVRGARTAARMAIPYHTRRRARAPAGRTPAQRPNQLMKTPDA
jgi:hypothetical protein